MNDFPFPVNLSNYFFMETTNNSTAGEGVYRITPDLIHRSISRLNQSMVDHGYIILVVLYVFIFILAACGNGLVILLAIKYKRMRSRRNVFLINLSVADLQVAIVCIPAGVSKLLYPFWIYGEFLCRVTHALQATAVMGSVFTLVAMSIDRMVTVRAPSANFFTVPTLTAILAAIWLSALGVAFPIYFYRVLEPVGLPPSNFANIANFTTNLFYCTECFPSTKAHLVYTYTVLVITFVLPLFIISVAYIYVGEMIKRATQFDNNMPTPRAVRPAVGNGLIRHRSRHARRMIVILVITFFVCWFPFNVTIIIIDMNRRAWQLGSNLKVVNYLEQLKNHESALLLKAASYTQVLGHLHSALSPIIYWFVNASFQTSLRKLFDRSRKRRHSRLPRLQLDRADFRGRMRH